MKQVLSIDDVCQHVTAEIAAGLLGWSESTLQKFVNTRQHELGDEWHWHRGVCYFQASERGALMYNAWALKYWHIARSQNNAAIYTNAVGQFQKVIGG
jgi:hypothetical protein